MKLTKELEAEIIEAYKSFWVANLSANMEVFASYLTEDFSIIGSAVGETYFSKKDAIAFYTATAEELKGKAELRNRNISIQPVRDNMVVARELSDLYILMSDAWTFYGHARISCVMIKVDDVWKAVHQHASFADHRTEEGQQQAAKKIEKENLELREAVQRRTIELQSKNRELEIEAAVERVRARTMAMQHSDELADASFVLDTQVRSLGIETWGCAFNIYGDNESTEWFSSEGGTLPAYKTPREDFFLRAYEAGKQGQQIYIEEFAGGDCKAHYDYLLTIPIMGDALRGMLAAGRSFPERQIDHATFFKYGHLLFITPEHVPDSHDIFIRFAKVFEQTYTRFLDLQKAEAQAIRAEQDLKEIKEARKKAEDTLIALQATQKQLIQSEKMASLGELTAGIAHEIQNPLNFVNNFSDVSSELLDEMSAALVNGDMEEVEAIATDIKNNLEKINHHGKRADAIVKGMLQHSRKSEGQKEPTDINALCDEYLRLSYHGLRAKDKSFNAHFTIDFDSEIKKVNVLPQEIGRLLLNLLNNAFYAVAEKSKAVKEVYAPTVSIQTKKLPHAIEITVLDNGNGIPDAVKEKIFQPFFTTKPTGQGTGLGLSISYDIVKAHGGELKVDSKEGEFTRFVITLPV